MLVKPSSNVCYCSLLTEAQRVALLKILHSLPFYKIHQSSRANRNLQTFVSQIQDKSRRLSVKSILMGSANLFAGQRGSSRSMQLRQGAEGNEINNQIEKQNTIQGRDLPGNTNSIIER
uniref:Uncharacterized protein n=1 Tax=Micrurus surinamensis TaxID=129470 RepID=A0A2D4PQU4_MICSU